MVNNKRIGNFTEESIGTAVLPGSKIDTNVESESVTPLHKEITFTPKKIHIGSMVILYIIKFDHLRQKIIRNTKICRAPNCLKCFLIMIRWLI